MRHHSSKFVRPFVWSAALCFAIAALAAPPVTPKGGPDRWPSVDAQIRKFNVKPGTALEQFIRAHQDFSLLRPEEASDTIPVPLWLRVAFRQAHPELTFSADDPTGGYPLVLKEAAEWMKLHQDLVAAPPEPDVPASPLTTSSGNVRISGSATNPRSESDIRINYWDTSKVIAACNNIGSSGRQVEMFSSDGGTNWGQTTLPLASGDSFHSDPTVDWTSNGSAWSTTIGINSFGTVLKMRAYKSTDGGATWALDNTFSGSQSSTDKQMVWADHSATSTFKDQLYAIWHNGNPCYMNRRTATGWGTPIQVSGAESTGTAIGADVKTNASGDVFGAWPTTGNAKIFMVKSTNGGVSYGTPVQVASTFDSYDIGVPAMNTRRALIYVTLSAYSGGGKNNVYATWTDLSGATGCTAPANEPGSNTASSCKSRIWFARSTNGGATWQAKVKINDQASLNDQFNQWMAVDETSGRISVMYYDTVGDAGRKKTDVWYQTSTDDGVTWSAPFKVTTAMTDETVSGSDGNQYGDYNGLNGHAGNFFPVWTDRRNNAREEVWTAKVSETPCTPPSAPTGLTAVANGVGRIDLMWSAVAAATEYHVLRGVASGGPYSQIAVVASPGTSYPDTGLSPGTYYYVVRAYAGCESGNSNEASATAIGGGGCTTQTLYTNGFESGSGLADWTVGTFVSGGSTASWRGIQICTAQTGTGIFRYGGTTCTTDYTSNNFTFAKPSGATGIAVPAGATTTRLSFGHRRRFESGFDGGTLALSVNGTNYVYVPASAILSGASYNGTTATSCPPTGSGGVAVFTGVQSTFVSTTVDLDAACNLATGGSGGCAGRPLHIAFTSITDCSVTDDGWFLDNVQVTACVP